MVCHLGKKPKTQQNNKAKNRKEEAKQTSTQHLNQTLSQPFLSALSHLSLLPLQEGVEKCSAYVSAQQLQNELKNSH